MRTVKMLLPFAVLVLLGSNAIAAEKEVTLAVEKMTCALCPITVKAALEDVAGVKQVVVSLKEKTAIVVFDDAVASVERLREATANAGYPSTVKQN